MRGRRKYADGDIDWSQLDNLLRTTAMTTGMIAQRLHVSRTTVTKRMRKIGLRILSHDMVAETTVRQSTNQPNAV